MTMKNKISLFCLSGGIWYLGETVVLSNLFKSLFLFVNYQSSIIKLKFGTRDDQKSHLCNLLIAVLVWVE